MITRRRTTRMSFTQTERTILRTEPAIDSAIPPSLPRSFTNSSSHWNLNYLKEGLPETPSPICSSASSISSPFTSPTCSSKSDIFFSQFPAKSSTSRNQSFCGSNVGKQYTSSSQVDGRMQKNYPQGIEECSVVKEYSGQANTQKAYEAESNGESPDGLRHNLMTRPKPYTTFLDEVKKEELEAEIQAWRKAKEMDLIGRLTRKEAAINEWERKKTSKIVEEMKKVEMKIERKRARALEKFEKRISITKEEANKKTEKARRETFEKISALSRISERARATKNLTWNKLMRLS